MKELSIEEKAKRYDEAMKAAVVAYKDEDKHLKATLESIFPELKESEDEKTRKEIIDFVKSRLAGFPDCKRFTDWLEKQGEQKPVIVPKFRVGDKIYLKPEHRMPDDDTPIADTIREIIAIDDKHYRFEGSFIFIEDQDKFELVEQKSADKVEPKFKVGDWVILDRPVLITKVEDTPYNTHQYWTSDGTWFGDATNAKLWDISDAKDGDVLARNNDILSICIFSHFDGINNKISSFLCHCGLEGEGLGQELSINGYYDDSINYVPATKEQREQLEKAMADAGYRWNPDEKKMEKIEQKPAWSEEDEKIIKRIDSLLYSQCKIHGSEYEEIHNWLKSLRPQNT